MPGEREMLLGLAERVEQASGPDRELDKAIAAALGWEPIPNPTFAGGLVGRWRLPDGSMSGMNGPPPVTASLDAALSLVPEGWHVDDFNSGDPTRPKDLGKARATVAPDSRNDAGWAAAYNAVTGALAATGPLALTAAALRALAAQQIEDSHAD